MTPVILLTDGYLANGSEPWRVPKLEDMKPFPVSFRTDPEGYQVYARDASTLARDWVKPGTPGLAHRVGGLEKDALTGDVSYDPENHERMCRTRACKVDRIKQEMGDLLVRAPTAAASCWSAGAPPTAPSPRPPASCARTATASATCTFAGIHPLHPKLGELMSHFDKVVVAEMNLGQLSRLIRDELLVDAQGLHKVQGKPSRYRRSARRSPRTRAGFS